MGQACQKLRSQLSGHRQSRRRALTQKNYRKSPESNDRYNHNSPVGDNCQICGRFVRGGNEAMMLHQRTSSRCAAAQGTSGEARVPCAYCGRRLAANNAWARQQHYQFCPGRQTDSDDNGSWSSRGSAGWQDNSYSRRHDSWHRSWDSDRWREENGSHPQSHRWHWYWRTVACPNCVPKNVLFNSCSGFEVWASGSCFETLHIHVLFWPPAAGKIGQYTQHSTNNRKFIPKKHITKHELILQFWGQWMIVSRY